MSQADSQQPKTRQHSKAPRRVSEIVAGLLLLLIVLFLALPALISTGPVTRFLTRKISQATRADIKLADLSLGWRQGIVIQGLDVISPDGRDRIRVKRIHSRPNLLALMYKRWHLGKTVIDEPVVECKLSPHARSSTSTSARAPVASTSSPTLPIKSMDVEVHDGRVQLTSAENHVLDVTGINSSFDLHPVGQSSFFEIALNVPDRQQQPSSIRAKGQLKRSQKGWVLGLAAGQWNVDVNQLDLAALQPLADIAGVKLKTQGHLSADLKGILEQDHTVGLKGTVHVRNLDVTPGAWQGDHLASQKVDLDLDVQTFHQQLIVKKAALQSDWGQAQLQGQVPLDPNQWRQIGQLSGSMDVQVAQIMQQMPHLLAVQPGMRVTDGQLAAQLDWLNGRLHGQATLKQLAGQVHNRRASLSRDVTAKVQMDLHAPEWTLDTLTLDSAFAQLQVKGNRQRLEVDNQLDLSRFQAEVGQFIDFKGWTLAGQMRSQAVVTLDQNDMNVNGTAQLRQLVLGRAQAGEIYEPQAGVSLQAGWNTAEHRLKIGSLSLNGSLGTLAVKDATGHWPQDTPMSLHVPLQVQDLNMAKALQWAKTLRWAPNDVNVAGKLAGQFVVDADHDTYHLRSQQADVTALSVQLKDKKPFTQSTVKLALDTEINPVTRRIEVHDFQWTSPQIKIQRAQLEKHETAGTTQVSGAVRMDYDWKAVQPLVANVLPAGLEVQGRSLDFKAQMPSAEPDLSRLSAQVKIGCQGARYQGLELGAMDVNAVVKEGLLTLEPFTTTANQGQLAFGCQGDFLRHPPVFYTESPLQVARDVHITTAMTQSLFQYINPLFANIDSVSGRADFYCERLVVPLDPNAKDQIKVTGVIDCNDVVVQGSTLFSQLRLHPQEFRIHPTHFVLTDGVLSYKNMQIDVGNNPVNFSGHIGLDQHLDMTVTLPYTYSGRTARVGQVVADRIAVPLTGTLKKPQVDVNKFLQQGLKEQLPNILNDVLKRL